MTLLRGVFAVAASGSPVRAGRQLAERLAAGFQQIRSAVEVVRGRPERLLRVTAEPAFAARWLLQLSDRATNESRAAFSGWLAESVRRSVIKHRI